MELCIQNYRKKEGLHNYREIVLSPLSITYTHISSVHHIHTSVRKNCQWLQGCPYIGANGVSWPPLEKWMKNKKRKHAKMSSFLNGSGGWGDTRDDWLVKLCDCNHHPPSRVSHFLYILQKSRATHFPPRNSTTWVPVFPEPLYTGAGTGSIY